MFSSGSYFVFSHLDLWLIANTSFFVEGAWKASGFLFFFPCGCLKTPASFIKKTPSSLQNGSGAVVDAVTIRVWV